MALRESGPFLLLGRPGYQRTHSWGGSHNDDHRAFREGERRDDSREELSSSGAVKEIRQARARSRWHLSVIETS